MNYETAIILYELLLRMFCGSNEHVRALFDLNADFVFCTLKDKGQGNSKTT